MSLLRNWEWIQHFFAISIWSSRECKCLPITMKLPILVPLIVVWIPVEKSLTGMRNTLSVIWAMEKYDVQALRCRCKDQVYPMSMWDQQLFALAMMELIISSLVLRTWVLAVIPLWLKLLPKFCSVLWKILLYSVRIPIFLHMTLDLTPLQLPILQVRL